MDFQIPALSLVHERGELFKLWRRHVFREKGDDILDAIFMRRERLKRIAYKKQIPVGDSMRIEDRTARIEAVREK